MLPYIGIDEISSDKVGTAKALVAELLGTLILVNIIFIAMLRIFGPETDLHMRER